MVGRHKNRWLRRWLVVIIFWAVPVAIVAVREIQEEMAYNRVDLNNALTTWELTDAQRAAGAAARCRGKPDDARAAGCPADVLAANAPRQQEALNEYAIRKSTLAGYLWHAFVGYWVVPAAILFAIGFVIGLVRRALRRPPVNKSPANH
ncbi:hypothetical protein [Paraburkholderia sp. C35]|uniref:hypothetical protein n=1 Tax=Paraburkholderia sp. C35 TaxID=2126993 RepID=UPI000D6864B1|nr:hypothetical protein [Paraburkholderia sp. C35]